MNNTIDMLGYLLLVIILIAVAMRGYEMHVNSQNEIKELAKFCISEEGILKASTVYCCVYDDNSAKSGQVYDYKARCTTGGKGLVYRKYRDPHAQDKTINPRSIYKNKTN